MTKEELIKLRETADLLADHVRTLETRNVVGLTSADRVEMDLQLVTAHRKHQDAVKIYQDAVVRFLEEQGGTA